MSLKRRKISFVSESAYDFFLRLRTPPLDTGIPLMDGCVHGGSIVEIASSSRWLLTEIFSFLEAKVSTDDSTEIHVVDIQKSVDIERLSELASGLLRDRADGNVEERALLESIPLHRCENAVHVIAALRCISEDAKEQNRKHKVVFIDGLSNLFWTNRVSTKGRTLAPIGLLL